MDLWILTEERPKKDVIKQIVKKVCTDNGYECRVDDVRIIPVVEDQRFTFKYTVDGISVDGFDVIWIKVVCASQRGSFVDFLVFFDDEEPTTASIPEYLIEETKTSDYESRNTGVYQRATKFVLLDRYYPDSRKLMLYNIRIPQERPPTDTSIFGTRMFRNLGIEILGKDLDDEVFRPFEDIDELIDFKNSMRPPPGPNTPITIVRSANRITVSGRLVKSGRLAHDPNIGALSLISRTLRELGWEGEIVITQHGLVQSQVNRGNKFIKVADKLNIQLDGLTVPETELPEEYWRYDMKSEKNATIFLHVVLENDEDTRAIFDNHGGCEKGYFEKSDGELEAVHKYIENDRENGSITLPDLVVRNVPSREAPILEGKRFDNLDQGLEELDEFDAFEVEYVNENYPDYDVSRLVVLFGGTSNTIEEDRVAFLLNVNGEVAFGDNCPDFIREVVSRLFD